MIKAVAFALSLLIAHPAHAQSVIDCSGWQGAARNIPEPWEAHTRTFANGEIRVAMLDTIEPAAGAFYLVVLAPPYDELGSRNCALVAAGDGSAGFSGMFFDRMQASYDPAIGLTISTPVQQYDSGQGSFEDATLDIYINQARGTINALVY